jgi:leader peptidase (prepilin peptidase)/N-methyltransferase
MALTVYDLRWLLLPNKLVFPLIGLAIIQLVAIVIYEMDLRPIFMAMAGVSVVAGIFYALFHISNGAWIGGGDVKLGIVLGILAAGS